MQIESLGKIETNVNVKAYQRLTARKILPRLPDDHRWRCIPECAEKVLGIGQNFVDIVNGSLIMGCPETESSLIFKLFQRLKLTTSDRLGESLTGSVVADDVRTFRDPAGMQTSELAKDLELSQY